MWTTNLVFLGRFDCDITTLSWRCVLQSKWNDLPIWWQIERICWFYSENIMKNKAYRRVGILQAIKVQKVTILVLKRLRVCFSNICFRISISLNYIMASYASKFLRTITFDAFYHYNRYSIKNNSKTNEWSIYSQKHSISIWPKSYNGIIQYGWKHTCLTWYMAYLI